MLASRKARAIACIHGDNRSFCPAFQSASSDSCVIVVERGAETRTHAHTSSKAQITRKLKKRLMHVTELGSTYERGEGGW